MAGYSHNPIRANQRFGSLLTIKDVGRAADGHRVWLCACDCGVECERQTNNLRSAGFKSCGCAQKELQKKHGMKNSPEYSSWQSMKARCRNPSYKDYPRYGGRGISVCSEWADSFEAFFSDMGQRPAGMTLERIDTNGHYEPGNCEWATPTEQARNRRRSVYVNWKSRRVHLADVANELGITYGAAFMRLKRGKLNAERI